MKCTKDQFMSIKTETGELGYYLYGACKFKENPYLVANKTYITTTIFTDTYGDMIFEEWNGDLFLALAAMSNNPTGVPGEWWVFDAEEISDPVIVELTIEEIAKRLNMDPNLLRIKK